MVKMSDIFKRKDESGEGKKPESKEESKPIPGIFKKPAEKESAQESTTESPKISCAKPTPIDLTNIMQKKTETETIPLPSAESRQECSQVYQKCIDTVDRAVKNVSADTSITTDDISNVVHLVLEQLEKNRDILIELAYCNEGDEYLAYHLVNVLIFSLIIGMSLGYSKDQLFNLGLVALMHDVGMVHFLELAEAPRKLTEDEFKAIKGHVHNFKTTGQKEGEAQIINAIQQHHERIDGSGYPGGIKGSAINEIARIIAAVDTFEALTHKRAWRPRRLAFDAIKEILDKKFLYDSKVLKALIDHITIYPTGSRVLLNTEDIAKVVKLQPSSPLRPVIQILQDAAGNVCEEPKIIDLVKNPTLFIKKPIDKQNN